MSAAVSSSHSFSTASTQDKFHGLLEVKPIVKVRQITNQFFQYLRDSVPPHKILLQILMYWVLIVWVLNSFFLNSPVLFIDGTVIKTFMSYVAIIQRFTPTGIDTNLFLYFGIAYNVLFIIIFFLYGVAINSLKKTNKIPMYICKISTFFYDGVSHVFGFTGLNMAGDQIGKFISKNPTRTYSQTEVTATYIVFIFLIVFLLYSFYLNYRYSTAILTFRCVLFNPFFSEINCVFIILLYFLSFISALSSHLDIVGKAVIFGIMLITYISFALLVIFKYDFVNIGTKSALIGVTIGSSINTFVQLALSIIVNQLYEALIATEIIVMVAICLITHLLLIKKKEKLLQNLDLIMNDQSLFDSIVKSERIALSLMANGFQIAHPIIMSNEFQKLAIDKFPKSIKILILWARFCSAFPAEAKTLVYLEDQIKKLRIKGRISTFRMQIRLLIHQREALLSPSFKKNLNKISRLSNTARNRQRRFWESVIQGNISDMETASAASQDSVLSIESEINHLISMYPNNQYIARENSKYLLKIRGDVIGFSFWHQNYTKLKSGQTIVEDKAENEAHQLFPILNDIVKESTNEKDLAIANLLDSSVTSSHSRSIVFEPADLADDGIYASIRSAITSIKFPVIRMTNIMILFYFLLAIVIAAPVTLLIVAIQLFTTTELVMISAYTSTVSVNSAHMAIVATRDFFRRVNGFENSSEYVHENGYPDSLGNSSDPSIQMSFMINKVDDLLIKMKKVYDYSADDIPSLYTFTQIIFEPTNTFYSYQVIDYPDNVTKTVTMKSIDAAMTYMGILGNQIISTKKEEHDNLIKSYEFPTLFNHAERTYTGLISACDAMSTYYNDSISQILDALMFLVPLYICILLVLCIVFIVIINKKIQETKWSVMHSFLTVPKQAISQIVQSMKIHGQDEDSEEDEDEDVEVIRNKHEDNMLAILSSFVDKPEGNAMFMISSGIVILFLFGLASLLFIYLYIKEPGNSLIITAAQTRNIGFSYTSSILTYLELLRIASAQYGHKFPGDDMATSLNMTNELISSSRKFLRNAKIGQKDPFYVSPISQIDSHAYNILFDNQNTNCTPHSMNQFDNLIKCRATDTDYMILDYYIEQVVSELTNVDRESGDISKSRAYDLLEKIWYVGSNYIYDQAIAPELDNLPIVAFDNFNGKIQIMILCIALVIIATLFLALFLLVEVQKINKHLKWMVEMMMHLPPDTLLSSKAIVSVLSGHFSEKERKSANLSDAFYNSVIEKFLDAVFFTDLNLCITKVNPAAERIFSTNPIGKDFLSLNFMHNKNYDSLKNMINGIINKTGKVQSSQNVKMISADGAKLYLNVSITPINGNGVIKTINADTQIENLIFVIRDITQNRRSDKLLKEEKMRSDSLLRHILPPVIVDGLQQGEKDISFSVPSASVLFMDIVEFTPWCASLQAAQVMSTLNMLFKEFDIALAQYSTLTKIKCIGDCYMCAGGIFETNNQPKIHAHETVSFGIDSIKAVLKVNSEINQNLRIRVGVNTGGPLVAGVLGIDRPTFEILGPAINMAQQMEHHGIPMMVHISPTVYELIFGGNLNIKERGEVEVKSGVMTTYLVTPE